MEMPDRSGGADPYERLARKGLAAYGLADAEISLLSHKERIVFSVIDDGPNGREVYALRIGSREESKKQLLRESLFLEELRRDLLLDVPEPVLTRNGEIYRSVSTPGVPGFRLVSLFRWVGGRHLSVEEWTIDLARAVGRMIGEIHLASEGFDWPDELAPEDRSGDPIPPFPGGLSPKKQEELEGMAELATGAIGSLADDRKAHGVIHGSLTPEHILFSSSGIGAIGFSSCRYGYYPYDLATVAAVVLEPLREGLVAGYREVRNLNPELLPGFIALRRLELLARRRA